CVWPNLYRRWVRLETHAARWNSDLGEALALIVPESFEHVHPPPPEERRAIQQIEKDRRAASLGDCAFGMKIGDAIDELLAQDKIGRRDPMQKQRRATREQNGIGGTHVAPQAQNEARIDARRPQKPAQGPCLVIRPRGQLDLTIASDADRLARIAVTPS